MSFYLHRRRRVKKVPILQQNFSQGETSPGDTGFHSPQIQVQDLGDLLVGESGQLPHDQHLAVVIREGQIESDLKAWLTEALGRAVTLLE